MIGEIIAFIEMIWWRSISKKKYINLVKVVFEQIFYQIYSVKSIKIDLRNFVKVKFLLFLRNRIRQKNSIRIAGMNELMTFETSLSFCSPCCARVYPRFVSCFFIRKINVFYPCYRLILNSVHQILTSAKWLTFLEFTIFFVPRDRRRIASTS